MKFTHVNEKHIYNVIFDPVRNPEFDGTHLALVLKKNNDGQTVVVMPMTTSSNGDLINKKDLGVLNCLPESLRLRGNSFAVFNQIRTVHVSRMISLKDKNNIVQCKIDDNLFTELLELGISDIVFSLSSDEKINFFHNLAKKESTKKITSLIYDLLKLRKNKEDNKNKIEKIETEIKNSLIFKDYNLPKIELQEILKEFLS